MTTPTLCLILYILLCEWLRDVPGGVVRWP
jgi:hypothetical protein